MKCSLILSVIFETFRTYVKPNTNKDFQSDLSGNISLLSRLFNVSQHVYAGDLMGYTYLQVPATCSHKYLERRFKKKRRISVTSMTYINVCNIG